VTFAALEPWRPVVVLLIAVALDLALGEPPTALHPVAWMGSLAARLERRAPRSGPLRQWVAGTWMTLAVACGSAAVTGLVCVALRGHTVAGIIAGVVVLKPMFALRALGQAAAVVRDALRRGDLSGARFGLRSLCSRDATELQEPALVAASIESVAENASDSFVAPLFYYVLFGLPGAVFYRAVNTLDAMIGYRGRYEYLGKTAARLDDVLNFVPARLTALLLVLGGSLAGHDARRGIAIWLRDGARTESPNAGRPMAAMAGLLRVELEKSGHYRLGDAIGPLETRKIDQAWQVVVLASAIGVALASAALGVKYVCLG
jgi:adenosylcobinamide-phosphate synthase